MHKAPDQKYGIKSEHYSRVYKFGANAILLFHQSQYTHHDRPKYVEKEVCASVLMSGISRSGAQYRLHL